MPLTPPLPPVLPLRPLCTSMWLQCNQMNCCTANTPTPSTPIRPQMYSGKQHQHTLCIRSSAQITITTLLTVSRVCFLFVADFRLTLVCAQCW